MLWSRNPPDLMKSSKAVKRVQQAIALILGAFAIKLALSEK
jgi:hypothetical protein